MGATGRDIWEITACADRVREGRVGKAVTYVRNQNINVTNICVNACGFCGFSRKRGDPDAYFFERAAVQKKAAQAKDSEGDRDLHGQRPPSRLHRRFLRRYPHLDPRGGARHPPPRLEPDGSGLRGEEEWHLHGRDGGTPEGGRARVHVRDRDRDPGGTGPLLDLPRGRWTRPPGSGSSARYTGWASRRRRPSCMAIARALPIRSGTSPSSAPSRTTPVGSRSSCPSPSSTWRHPSTGRAWHGPGRRGRRIPTIAVSRLFLDNILHIQSSWVRLGVKLAQLGLISGADDLGGTVFEESISRGAGARGTDYLDPGEMERMAGDLGRALRQRTTLYDSV